MASEQKTTKTVDLYHCKLRANARKNLYLNAQISDVNFVFYEKTEQSSAIGDNEEDSSKSKTKTEIPAKPPKKLIEKVPAQKCVLASVCEAFFAMFYGPVKMEGDVEIVDASPEALKEFLQCFYLDQVRFTEENIADVIKLADKYGVTDCMDTCVAFLMDILTPDGICWAYHLAIFYDLGDLQVFCEQQIALNAVQVFGSSSFFDCDRQLLKKILSLKVMPCNETVILDSCLNWASKACELGGLDGKIAENIRAQLGDCLPLIRFGTISIEELCKRCVICDGLFSSMTVDSKTKRFWWDPTKIWKCNRTATKSTAYYVDRSEVIYVTSNKTALLGAIYFAALTHPLASTFKKSATITVKEIPGKSFNSRDGTVLYRKCVDFGHNEAPNVQLPVAVIIDERNTYEIRFDMPDLKDFYTLSVYNNKVDSVNGLSIEFTFDTGRGHLISSLDMNHL